MVADRIESNPCVGRILPVAGRLVFNISLVHPVGQKLEAAKFECSNVISYGL